MSEIIRSRWLRPFQRLADALADPLRGNRAALLVIAAYVLAWWIYAVVAKSSQDIHFDMGEAVSWSLVPAYGYPKHPPFPAWVATVWFAIFPYTDWAFYLLATASIGVALWFVWLIAARHVDGPKRAIALAMLMFSPGFNFQPLKFNSNSLLIPVWAAASYLFLRSFSERTVLWGVLAGAGAALAMLTKYWSIFLVLAFVAGALAHPRRWDYMRSPAPWTSVAAGALIFAPNIASLVHYDFQPFDYAVTAHGVMSLRVWLGSLADYAGGALYLAGGLVALIVACRPGRAAVRDMLLPREPDRRQMMLVTGIVFLAPVLLALPLHTRLATLWTLPMWAMLPAALLSSHAVSATRDAAAGTLAAAAAVALAAILLSPAIAITIHRNGVPNNASHYRLIAAAVDKAWQGATPEPMKLFGSDTNIVNGASFYLPGRPLRIDIVGPRDTPWADEAQVARDGIAMVCAAQSVVCMAALERRSATATRSEVTLSRTYFGSADAPVRYMIAIVPPRG